MALDCGCSLVSNTMYITSVSVSAISREDYIISCERCVWWYMCNLMVTPALWNDSLPCQRVNRKPRPDRPPWRMVWVWVWVGVGVTTIPVTTGSTYKEGYTGILDSVIILPGSVHSSLRNTLSHTHTTVTGCSWYGCNYKTVFRTDLDNALYKH